jgi:hypothetical protein
LIAATFFLATGFVRATGQDPKRDAHKLEHCATISIKAAGLVLFDNSQCEAGQMVKVLL